jgi:hypothetical protein
MSNLPLLMAVSALISIACLFASLLIDDQEGTP